MFCLPNAATMVVSVVESVSDPEENPSSILPPPSKNKTKIMIIYYIMHINIICILLLLYDR